MAQYEQLRYGMYFTSSEVERIAQIVRWYRDNVDDNDDVCRWAHLLTLIPMSGDTLQVVDAKEGE